MISVKDLHKSFGGVTVLDGISTQVERGDVVCIIGPSGSGKSTLLRSLLGLLSPLAGKIDCPALSSPDDEAMAAELGRSISAFLRTQSEEVRSMFILRYFYCEPVEALAARFHCGESRIKTTLLRTRRKLKEHLIKEGYCEA